MRVQKNKPLPKVKPFYEDERGIKAIDDFECPPERQMNPPKGIDPRVWEMALGVAEPINSGTILYGIIAESAARAISQAIEAERAEIVTMLAKESNRYDRYDPHDTAYACIGRIRNRSNTTTER